MKTLQTVVLILIVLIISFTKPVFANDGFDYVGPTQTIDSDYIRVANTIQIDGQIHGDAFLVASVVTVNGKIDGDLFVVAPKVNVNGTIGSNIRIAGVDVVINGPVGRNALLLCGNCSVGKQSMISGSVLASGINLDLFSQGIGRGVRFIGNRLYLNTPVGSEAFVVADREFFLGPMASISGDLKYTGKTQVIIQPGASVSGTISYQQTDQDNNFPKFFGARTVFDFYQKIKPLAQFLGFVVSVLIGWIFLGLFPVAFEKVSQAIENRPYASFGWGIIILLLIPLLVVLFAITIVGLPVSFVLIIASYVCYVLAQFLAAFFLGRRILLRKFGERRGWALVLGLFLIYLLGFIPIVGDIIKVILVIFSLGAIVPAYKQPVILVKKSPQTVSRELARIDRKNARLKKNSPKN